MKRNPTPEAFNTRGVAYARVARYQEAIADFSQAIKLDAGNAAAFTNRALAYRQIKREYHNDSFFTHGLLIRETILGLDTGTPLTYVETEPSASGAFRTQAESMTKMAIHFYDCPGCGACWKRGTKLMPDPVRQILKG